MTTKEAARELGFSYRTVLNLLNSGRISGKLEKDRWDVDPESVQSFKDRKENNLTVRDVARSIGCPYLVALEFIKTGRIKATRNGKGPFSISKQAFRDFKRGNDKRVEALRKEYLRRFYEGESKDSLQERVPDDFKEKGVFYPARGFVEVTIYNDMMEQKRKGAVKQ